MKHRELRGRLRFVLAAHRLLPIAPVNPAKRVEAWARATPEKLALAYQKQRYSWREYNGRANQYASWFLEQGIRAGEVVALLMDNRPDFLFAVMGLNKTLLDGLALVAAHVVHPLESRGEVRFRHVRRPARRAHLSRCGLRPRWR